MVGTEQDVEELIARAYEAGAEMTRWPRFLERLGALLADVSTALQVEDVARASGSFAASVGLDRTLTEAYERYYAALNPWTTRAAADMQPGRALLGEHVITPRELVRTEFYNDFLRPQGVMYSLGAVIERDGDVVAFVSLARSERQGPWQPDEVALVERLLPHMRRALALHRRLASHRRAHEALLDTAERLPWAILVVDERGHVHFANRVARRLSRAMTTRVLGTARVGGGIVARPGQCPLAVTVAPVEIEDLLAAEGAALRAIIVIDPDAVHPPPVDRLRAAFALTRAEAELAVALTAGETLRDIQLRTGVGAETLRTHLKRLFDKTGTRRQAELVRLLTLFGGIA